MTSQKIKEEKKSDSNCGIVHIRKAAARLNGNTSLDLYPDLSLLLLAKTHNDEGNDQAIERDGFHQRKPDPHIFRDASFCFRLACHYFNHLPKDVADSHTGSGKPCCGTPHPDQPCCCSIHYVLLLPCLNSHALMRVLIMAM